VILTTCKRILPLLNRLQTRILCMFNIHADAGAATAERSFWFYSHARASRDALDSDHRRRHPLNRVYRFGRRRGLFSPTTHCLFKIVMRERYRLLAGNTFKLFHLLLVRSKLAPRRDYEIGCPKVLRRAHSRVAVVASKTFESQLFGIVRVTCERTIFR